MTVQTLINQLKEGISAGYIKPTDELIVLGSGDKGTYRFDYDLTIPPVTSCVFNNDNYGYIALGIYREKSL